jgi:phosphatidylinositol alpha-1,6-mannosyltransferase
MVNTLLGWDTYDPLTPVRWYYLPYVAWVMNRAERVVTMTRHMAASARKQGCRKEIAIIPHGSTMFDKHGQISIRQKHGIDENAAIILSLQRLHPRKGLTYLIDAAATVLQRFPSCCFLIGGTGPQEAELRQRVKERGIEANVIFAGFIADEQLPSYYEQARLFVLPSLYEGFGVVYVDALAMGLPVVTTANGGANDIVTDEVGILVPPADAAALSEGIAAALQREWSLTAIKTQAAQYGWEAIVDRYLDIYQSLVRPAKR